MWNGQWTLSFRKKTFKLPSFKLPCGVNVVSLGILPQFLPRFNHSHPVKFTYLPLDGWVMQFFLHLRHLIVFYKGILVLLAVVVCKSHVSLKVTMICNRRMTGINSSFTCHAVERLCHSPTRYNLLKWQSFCGW